MQLVLKFPKDGAAHAVLDVGLYEDRELTSADGETYPLVVRMETITEKGKADGHTLQVPAPPQQCTHVLWHVWDNIVSAEDLLCPKG